MVKEEGLWNFYLRIYRKVSSKPNFLEIKKANGAWGPYLRLTFTIIEEGELTDYKFCGLVKPILLKQSKFYRWVTNILGYSPDHKFCARDLIGKKCKVFLAKRNNYYTVIDISSKGEE